MHAHCSGIARNFWQRMVYGLKYMTAHCLTAFWAALFFHRWQWILLYTLFNETLEELCLGWFGAWANIRELPFAVEPRYDSIVLDTVLAPLLFSCLGLHVIHALDLPDPFEEPLGYDWSSCKRVLLPFAWFLSMITLINCFGWSVPGMIMKGVLQLCFLWFVCRFQDHSQYTILRVHFSQLGIVMGLLVLLWVCFIWDIPSENDEVLKAMLVYSLPSR